MYTQIHTQKQQKNFSFVNTHTQKNQSKHKHTHDYLIQLNKIDDKTTLQSLAANFVLF